MTRYALGIDLHGTLLNEHWKIESCRIPALKQLLGELEQWCDIFICTGNNLNFVNDFVDQEIRDHLTGYVLESGTIYSNKANEEILIDTAELTAIENLQQDLEKMKLPDTLYFAERTATISIFTKQRERGKDPRELWRLVKNIIAGMGKDTQFNVIHSDVAVDIVPYGVNKYTGITKASSLPIIAVADSYNDREFLLNARLSFLPANSYPFNNDLPLLKIAPLDDYKCKRIDEDQNIIYKANLAYTEGLIEILHCLVHKKFNNR